MPKLHPEKRGKKEYLTEKSDGKVRVDWKNGKKPLQNCIPP
jgi:hypothetical protein